MHVNKLAATLQRSMMDTQFKALGAAASQVVYAARQDRNEGVMPGKHPGRLVSLREIGELLDRSHSTVSRALEKEDLKPIDGLGAKQRYPLEAVIAARERLGLMRTFPKGQPGVRLAVSNFKGGVSKSTLTAHIAYGLALAGYRVLAIDLDPQATLSTLFGMHPDFELQAKDTVLPYLIGDQPDLVYALKPSELSNLAVIPASLGLEAAAVKLPRRNFGSQKMFWGDVLSEGISTIESEFDVVIMDCPPNMNALTISAALAADGLIVPLRPQMPDLASSAQFMTMFGEELELADTARLAITGKSEPKEFAWTRLVLTQGQGSDVNKGSEKLIEEYVAHAYTGLILRHSFPRQKAIENAANFMRTVYDVAKADIDSKSLARAIEKVNELVGELGILVGDAQKWKAARAEEVS